MSSYKLREKPTHKDRIMLRNKLCRKWQKSLAKSITKSLQASQKAFQNVT